jgi:iron(III) transport system substrate-binding protein
MIMVHKIVTALFVLTFLFITVSFAVSASKKPTTVAELALYSGSDRQQILEEGARKEGKLIFYTSLAVPIVRPLMSAFEKRYPYIKIIIWRAGGESLLPKILEEYKFGKHLCDVVEGTQLVMIMLQKVGVLQPYYSPHIANIQEGSITKAPGKGAFAVAFRESGIGLGYNTKQITREGIPKTYQDLLDPKWKGKVAIVSGNTGTSWMAAMLVTYGEDFVRRIAEQKFVVQMVSGRALCDMVINGEYMLSPTIFNSHVTDSRQKGAPVDWAPLEPVPVNVGQFSLPTHSANPHAALLFMDFELSKESAEYYKTLGYDPTRLDVSGTKTYKKFYGASTTDEVTKWGELFNRVFVNQNK